MKWDQWIVWALLPLVAFFGFMILRPVLKSARAQDKALQSGASIGGTRFTRDLGQNPKLPVIFESWAQRLGYKKHQTSTEMKPVYIRAPMGMMPVFVAIDFSGPTAKMEAWIIAPGAVEEGLTSGFSIRVPNWIGVSDVNKLLAEFGQEPIGKLGR